MKTIYKKDVINEIEEQEIKPETKEEKLLFSCLKYAWDFFFKELCDCAVGKCYPEEFEWEEENLVIKSQMPMNLALDIEQPIQIREEIRDFDSMIDDEGNVDSEIYGFAVYYKLGILKYKNDHYAFIRTEIRQDGELDGYTTSPEEEEGTVFKKIVKKGDFHVNAKKAFDALIKKAF